MLGARIAALRRKSGWSQAELARQLQVSPSAVGMYEQGRREPSAATLVAMSRVFRVSTDYLLTGQPHHPPDQQALTQALNATLQSAQEHIRSRKPEPLTRQELAALVAAMLLEP